MTEVRDGAVPLTLAEAAAAAGGRLHGPADVVVRGVTHDSRRVAPGSLFCAVPGLERDGSRFVHDAVARGAAAVLGRSAPAAEVPWIEVADARGALGPLAQRAYGDPSAELAVVGITGTNGKTTTSFLTAAVIESGVGPAAVLGTLGLRRGGRVEATGFTTLEAPDLARTLRSLAGEGIRGVAMEVSSHALVQHRVDGVRFAAGVFTNLTHEHLDYHGTLDRYREAKLRFFDLLREQGAWGIINLDDPSADEFRARGPRRQLTYAQDRRDADVVAQGVELSAEGSRVRVRAASELVDVRLALGGRFNVSNALAALGAALALEVPLERAAAAIAEVRHVPGRFELYSGSGRTVLIDYAHTPDAFERVLATARQLTSGTLTLVFGCGGERDREKRPEMGRIAARMADRVLLTPDNPRREPLERILRDIEVGLREAAGTWTRHDDRAAAIRAALDESRPGDLLVLLGKGDESYQEIAGVKHPYSDRDTVRAALAALEADGG